ncbi:hypothetical protein FBUS_02508 [Fasciolopsis buskii]|uniref:TMEM181 GOLD domain-containing protein n=1 Tax=Fasciolopsis buskii TaxID=27845 RepID=A0A8E0RSS9_9TREM|nr:hypothetical protein FBUS_02508 [Fasciolopsis buski]
MVFIISLALGLHGPSVLQQYSIMASRLTKVPSDFRTGPFHVTAPPLSVFHQEIWLSAFVKRAQLSENTGLFLTFNVSADVLVPNGMSTDNSQLADDDAHNFIRLRPTTVQSVTLRCLRAVCDELFLAHIIPVDFSKYHFTVRFSGLSPKPRSSDEKNEEEAPIVRIDDVAFVFRYYNPQFTYMELTSRFVFFILTEFVTYSSVMSSTLSPVSSLHLFMKDLVLGKLATFRSTGLDDRTAMGCITPSCTIILQQSVLSCSIFHKQLDSTVSGLLVSNYIFMLCAPVLACNLPRFAIDQADYLCLLCTEICSGPYPVASVRRSVFVENMSRVQRYHF